MNKAEIESIVENTIISVQNGEHTSHFKHSSTDNDGFLWFYGTSVEEYNPFLSGHKMKATPEMLEDDRYQIFVQSDADAKVIETKRMSAFYHLRSQYMS